MLGKSEISTQSIKKKNISNYIIIKSFFIKEKYYTSFYDKTEPRNDILDTFRPMREVVLGEIR